MKFAKPLTKGIFQKRYKRFFTDIEFEGELITAHCPNTGSMAGLINPGAECLFSSVDDPKRKLKHTLEMIKVGDGWVGVNTGHPNKLVRELFETAPLEHWQKFDRSQPEVKINQQSRIDLVFWNSQEHDSEKWTAQSLRPPLHLVEVKNVTLAEGDTAFFPDAVTSRGQKHLDELIELTHKGFSCEMVFVIQRTDCQSFRSADHIDPEYGRKLVKAKKEGVLITPLVCDLSESEIRLRPQRVTF